MGIADGICCQRAVRWQTNPVVPSREGAALFCDPSWTNLPPGEALVDVRSAAAPPRSAIPDLAVYEPQATTADSALLECR